jgi:putative zinc finger/helix-turn-helix YgiT family protein
MAKRERQPKPYPHRCPECGDVAVFPETIDYTSTFKYEGRQHHFVAPSVTLNKCRTCGATILTNRALGQVAEAFRVYANLLTAREMRDELHHLGLTQKEFARQIGVAPETVTRWLKHVQIQARALDKFVRIFFKSPEIREELRRMQHDGNTPADPAPGRQGTSVDSSQAKEPDSRARQLTAGH